MSASFNRGSLSLSRRAVLRGAGVALALPWLESLSRPAGAQAAPSPKRFVAVFLPNGAPNIWKPLSTGLGSAWRLSSLHSSLASLKSKVAIISGLENGSAFNASGSPSVEPSNGRQGGGWLTCVDAAVICQKLGVLSANGVSLDQVMAQNPVFAGKTVLPSLQVGLSTTQAYCDGVDCALSRSVSWQTETKPLYKTVDPLTLFNQLVGASVPNAGAQLAARRDARKSVLDAVLETATAARARLSASDKPRLDEFIGSVRSVEKRVGDVAVVDCSTPPTKPNFPVVADDGVYQRDGAGYTRAAHADLMSEMLALALQCDQTRIASYMLEDERNSYVFDFLPRRVFTPLTSEPAPGVCPEWYAGGQSGNVDDYATIVQWNIGKVAEFCQRLDGMLEDNGQSVLDNSVIYFGASMHGQDHSCDRLPVFTVGSGGGALRTDQHLDLGKRPLRDFYFSLMNGVYGLGVKDFGVNATGAPISMIDGLFV